MRRALIFLILLSGAILLAACAGSRLPDESLHSQARGEAEAEALPPAAAEFTFSLATSDTASSWQRAGGQTILQHWAADSDGQIALKFYDRSGIFQDDPTILTAVQNGVLDVAMLHSTAYLAEFVPELLLLNVPGLLPDQAVVNELLDTGWKERFNAYFNAQGLQLLCCQSMGSSWLSSSVPLDDAEDLVGLKIGCRNELAAAFWRALGAEPVQVSFSQVDIALRNGEIQAHSNGSLGFETAERSYVCYTDHGMIYQIYVMNLERYQALPEEVRLSLDECMAEVSAAIAATSRKLDSSYYGGICTELTMSAGWPAQRRAAAEASLELLRQQIDPALVDEFVAAVDAYTSAP